MENAQTDPYASPATLTADTGTIWSANEGQISSLGYYVFCLFFCWLVFPVLMMFWRYISIQVHTYEISAERLLERSGILIRDTEELELYRVKDIAIEEPIFHRLFGRGRVILATSDRSTPQVVLNCIPEPRYVADLLRHQVERCRVAKGVREID